MLTFVFQPNPQKGIIAIGMSERGQTQDRIYTSTAIDDTFVDYILRKTSPLSQLCSFLSSNQTL